MTYETATKFMKEVASKGSVLGLGPISEFIHRLNIQTDCMNIIHVAGTNGKGSTSSFLTAILAHAGYRVGRFSSPAVFDELETISISSWNEKALQIDSITREEYAELVGKLKQVYDQMKAEHCDVPTLFEFETALALCYFQKMKCDYVIMEVGMGGRLDATNVISHKICSVLASISMDHMQFLGDSLSKIAYEKAGIISEHGLVVSVNQPKEASEVIEEECKKKNAILRIAGVTKAKNITYSDRGEEFEYEGECYFVHLLGTYQIQNSILAITTAKMLCEHGLATLSKENIKVGIEQAIWRGRMERVKKHPLVYIDGAHNEGAAEALKQTIETQFKGKRLIYVIGMFADKDYHTVLYTLLPYSRDVVAVTTHTERALDSKVLTAAIQAEYQNLGMEQYHVYDVGDIAAGLTVAVQVAGPEDVILAFGSLSYLKDVKAYFADTIEDGKQ